MRRLFTIGFCLLIVAAADAQKKPKINKAKRAWEDGELVEAKNIIDRATKHEKTKDEGDTWYYRGLIYATIDTTTNESFAELKNDALETAMASFKKAEELDTKDKGYYITGDNGLPVLMNQQITGYFSHYFNKAVASYQSEEFGKASKYFENANRIMPEDTSSVTNAGYAAQANDNPERALKLFKKAIDAGAQAKGLFYNTIALLRQNERTDEALEVIQKGKEIYPTDNQLNRQEISILIDSGKSEEAKERLISAVENEPDDPALRFALGLLYEELEQPEKAKEAYEAAIEADPEHYESNFNLAVMVFTKANKLYKEQSQLGISSADKKRARELKPKIKEGFEKALPLWEKVYELKPNEKPAIETLAFLYAYLGMNDKAKEMKSKLEE